MIFLLVCRLCHTHYIFYLLSFYFLGLAYPSSNTPCEYYRRVSTISQASLET